MIQCRPDTGRAFESVLSAQVNGRHPGLGCRPRRLGSAQMVHLTASVDRGVHALVTGLELVA